MTEPKKETFKNVEDVKVPDEFYKIVNDFVIDILITFPEYTGIVSRWWNPTKPENKEAECLVVFRHCIKLFPERFFDILYKNQEIFKVESEENTEFLPGIVFKLLWSDNISDTTRETIWKYLQLILFSVIGSVHSTHELGDTAKLFEAINEDELKNKLQETFENMQNLFNINLDEKAETDETTSENTESNSKPNINMENMPTPEQIHEHINSMMGGKLGKLAMELAEETASDLNLDMDNTTDPKDIFQKLFKNPTKMMGMVKNIGNKIDEKIKSGEIKESELMSEGMELLNKMQTMPGMGDMQKMFSQMGIPGLGKGGKMNMGAMEAQLNKNMKAAKMRERMQAKAQSQTNKPKTSDTTTTTPTTGPMISEEEIIKIFSTGEKVEKTPRGAKPPTSNANAIVSETATLVSEDTVKPITNKKGKKKK
jgi:hypothetical protein